MTSSSGSIPAPENVSDKIRSSERSSHPPSGPSSQVSLNCPLCGQNFTVASNMLGQQMICPHCDGTIATPPAGAVSQENSPPPWQDALTPPAIAPKAIPPSPMVPPTSSSPPSLPAYMPPERSSESDHEGPPREIQSAGSYADVPTLPPIDVTAPPKHSSAADPIDADDEPILPPQAQLPEDDSVAATEELLPLAVDPAVDEAGELLPQSADRLEPVAPEQVALPAEQRPADIGSQRKIVEVLIPDGEGGYSNANARTATIDVKGRDVQLTRRSREEKNASQSWSSLFVYGSCLIVLIGALLALWFLLGD